MRTLIFAFVIGAGLALLPVPADAAKPVPVTPSISLASGSDARLGGTVSFDTVYPKNTKNPRVAVLCYQAGTLVYAETGSPDHVFLLGGAASPWLAAGGSASCEAQAYSDQFWPNRLEQRTIYATTTFNAAG